MRDRLPSAVQGYLFAVAVTAAAIAGRWFLDPWLGARLVLVTLFAAVAVTEWFAGYRAALLVTVLGYLGCAMLFIRPAGTLGLSGVPEVVGFFAYLVSSMTIIGFGEVMRKARGRAHDHEALLSVTLDSIGDAVVTTDRDGRVTSMNAAAEALTGWREQEAVGKPFDAVCRVLDVQTREPVTSAAFRARQDDTTAGSSEDVLLVSKDGAERAVVDRASPIRAGEGDVEGYVVVFHDVSARRQAELALRRSEAELTDFFEHASVGLHWVAQDGTILRANHTEVTMLGYARDEYVGRNIAEFHRDQPALADLLGRLARGETVHDVPARLRCKDGSFRDVEISSSGRFDDGRFVHTRCVTVDVTDRKRAEEAQRLLASIVAASDDAIISKTLDGIILSWNAGAERLFGYTVAEAVGQSMDLIIPPELRDQERELVECLSRGERVDHLETTRVSKTGRRIDVSLTISPLWDESGRVVGASKVARDITERKRVEEALRRADRKKDEFLATLAHELRNPLAPIRNSIEVLKHAEDDRERVRQGRETIERQLAHLVRLVDDLLDVSRITRDRLELRKSRVDLEPIVAQAFETCRPVADRRRQTIEVSLPDIPIQLEADPVRLSQVLSNLLHNACKFSEPGSTVWLRAERHAHELVLSVKDQGIGIPAEQVDNIFEMFTQVDDVPERSPDGLGIGLTLVKRLVELHDGRVSVRSDGPGRGSEFVVRLPIGEPVDADAAPVVASPDTAPGPRRRILVVDDNVDSAESLAMLLDLAGHETRTAHDGRDAVAQAETYRPDAVLLDIGLPKLSGLDACRLIRAQAWGQSMVLLALTGWGQDDDRRKSLEAGFDGHMVKPIDYEGLMRVLEARLAHRRLAGKA